MTDLEQALNVIESLATHLRALVSVIYVGIPLSTEVKDSTNKLANAALEFVVEIRRKT